MEAVFLRILNMSLTACYVIPAVLLARLLLRRAPKKYSYALWSVVAFRLCCPVSFSTAFSLLNLPVFDLRAAQGTVEYLPQNLGMMARPEVTVGIPAADAAMAGSLPAATPHYSANPMQIWLFAGAVLWCAGMAALLLYSAVSYGLLCRRLRTAVRLEGNVWQSDRVCSPFILGVVRPKIYIPFGLGEETQRYVLAHERFHLKHLDHLAKLFGFLLLTIHWFNPLCWLAFALMSRDLEMRCDEAVLAKGENIRRSYSLSLLSFASNRRFPAAGPLAFSENDVKSRVRNVLRWKKPKVWLTVMAAVLCAAVLAACAANPPAAEEKFPLDGEDVPKLSLGFDLPGPGDEAFLDGEIDLTEAASVSFQITYSRSGLAVEVGLRGDDGEEYAQSIVGGACRSTIADLPAGTYQFFVRNSEENLQYEDTTTEPLTVTGAVALTYPGLDVGEDAGEDAGHTVLDAAADHPEAAEADSGADGPETEDTDAAIGALFDEIAQSLPAADLPQSYLEQKPESYQALLDYGDDTMRYIFSEFLQGGQTGLKGQLMRIVMDELAGGEILRLYAKTGQEYFDAWLEMAYTLEADLGREGMEEHFPYAKMLLDQIDAQ